MPRVHTHYANLKVARDAPIEVIKAAYKSLSLKYHPDKHQGSEKAARIMRIINASYEVLSDPVSRLQHDQWIADQENSSPPPAEPPHAKSNAGPERQPDPPRPESKPPEFVQVKSGWFQKDGWQSWLAGVIMFILVIAGVIPWDKPAGVTTPDQLATPSTAAPAPNVFNPEQLRPAVPERHPYTRPQLGPNGQPWPVGSGYLVGFEEFNLNGASTLTVDNRQNYSDVLVKLYYRVGQRPTAVRVLFLKAKDWIKMENIAAGPYDLRYQDLDSGVISRSDPFDITEEQWDERQADGILHRTRATDMSLTLYTVIGGNKRFQTIGPEDFQ